MFALISPLPSALFPLVIAGELVFMAVVCNNPRWQRHIDSKQGAQDEKQRTDAAAQRYNQLYNDLDNEARDNFEVLRKRCELIKAVPHSNSVDMAKINTWQTDGVNKLLWVYLKLLHTRVKLNLFLKNVDGKAFDNLEKMTNKKLEELEKSDVPYKDRMQRSLNDTLVTIKTRRENLAKAKANFDFIGLELERISAKLTTLSELAINRQDPSMITSEVDDAAKSVESTEAAIGELNLYAGMNVDEESAPRLLGGAFIPDEPMSTRKWPKGPRDRTGL